MKSVYLLVSNEVVGCADLPSGPAEMIMIHSFYTATGVMRASKSQPERTENPCLRLVHGVVNGARESSDSRSAKIVRHAGNEPWARARILSAPHFSVAEETPI